MAFSGVSGTGAIQISSGFAFPNALLQHALGDLDKLSINVYHLERKRDRMVNVMVNREGHFLIRSVYGAGGGVY